MKVTKNQLKIIIENYLLEDKRSPDGEMLIHIVKSGENITKIANRYQLPVVNGRQGAEQIIWINDITKEDASRLQIGQKLKIPGIAQYTVKSGDTLSEIAEDFGVGLSVLKKYNNLESDSLSSGQTLLLPPKKPGESGGKYTYSTKSQALRKEKIATSVEDDNESDSLFDFILNLFATDDEKTDDETLTGKTSFNPSVGNMPFKGTNVVTSVPSPYRLFSRNMHEGIDFRLPPGGDEARKVYPIKAGIVVEAKYIGGYGNSIIVEHDDGSKSRYAHLKSFIKKSGNVTTSEAIGIGGSSGTNAPHLHLEIISADSPPISSKGGVGTEKRKKYLRNPNSPWVSSVTWLEANRGSLTLKSGQATQLDDVLEALEVARTNSTNDLLGKGIINLKTPG
jgi:murein DD-endopeptidase MepM/ murein hydrolase activator NlpD